MDVDLGPGVSPVTDRMPFSGMQATGQVATGTKQGSHCACGLAQVAAWAGDRAAGPETTAALWCLVMQQWGRASRHPISQQHFVASVCPSGWNTGIVKF